MAGKDIKVNMIGSGLPNVSTALIGWEVNVTADYITQDYDENNDIINTHKKVNIKGVLQPLKPNEVNLKPEGQRNWNWNMLHVQAGNPALGIEQIIEINSIPYKVMAIKDYELYGYIEYHVIKDFE